MTDRRRKRRRDERGERGIALVLVLLVLAALSLIGLTGSRSTQTELQFAGKELAAKQALGLAESGISHAYSLIRDNSATNPPSICADCWGLDSELRDGGTGGALANVGGTALLDGVRYRFRPSGTNGDGYFVRAADNFDEPMGRNEPNVDKDNRIHLVARARVRGAERVLTALITGTSMFPYGLFGKTAVSISGGSLVDSFDSRIAPYSSGAGTNGDVRSNGNVTLSGNGTSVHGDALASGRVTAPNGAVTGTSTDGVPPVALPPVAPCGPPYSLGAGMSGGSYDPRTGELRGNGHANITLAGGTYCFSSITLNSGSTLTVSSPVKLYLTAESDFSGGSIVNMTQLASNLRIFLSLVSANKGITVSAGSAVYAAIYAPDAAVKITGGTDFYGGIVSGSLTDTGGARIHYDEALAETLGPTMQLSGLHEVRN